MTPEQKRAGGVLLLLATVLLLALLVVQTRGKDEKKPEGEAFGRAATASSTNILIIVADDVGVDKVGAYASDASNAYRGNSQYLPDTPTLDALAANGVRFTDAWANPTCSPTRAALLTGTHAFRHQVGEAIGKPDSHMLDDDTTTTIAEAVAERGYASGLFGKWHLGHNDPPEDWAEGDTWEDHLGQTYTYRLHPIDHGFQRFSGTIEGDLEAGGGGGSYFDWVAEDAVHCDDCSDPDVVVAEARTEYATDSTVRDALAWIDEQDGPWLAVVALHAAHEPLELPVEGCSYRSPDDPAPTSDKGVYKEMVECMDRSVGDLLDGLDDLDDTLVIFMGDNGTGRNLAEGPFDDSRGKGTIYENGVRVPLILADGKQLARQRDTWSWSQDWMLSATHTGTAGRALEDPVHVVDLFATIAQATGASAATAVDSVSLAPLLQDTTGDIREYVYTEQFDSAGEGAAALRRDNYKLIAFSEAQGFTAEVCRTRFELYDLDADRFETTDLAAEEPELLTELADDLLAVTELVEASWLAVPEC